MENNYTVIQPITAVLWEFSRGIDGKDNYLLADDITIIPERNVAIELPQSKGNIKERMLALNQQQGGELCNESRIRAGVHYPPLHFFFQLKTQDKSIPHSFERKKMREEKKKSVLFPDIQTIFVKSALYLKSGYFLKANKDKSPRNN